MAGRFSGRLLVTGVIGVAALTLSPAAGIIGHAQTFSCGNLGGGNCPVNSGNGNNATSNQFSGQVGLSLTNSTANSNASNNSIAQSFSDPSTTIVQGSTQNAVNNNGNGSLNTVRGHGGHEVSVNGRTFVANGGGVGGGSFVSLGVGGASNTGGAPLE